MSNFLDTDETSSYRRLIGIQPVCKDCQFNPFVNCMRQQRAKDSTGILFVWVGFTEFQFSYLMSIRRVVAHDVANHWF